jgi:hypothetical protein
VSLERHKWLRLGDSVSVIPIGLYQKSNTEYHGIAGKELSSSCGDGQTQAIETITFCSCRPGSSQLHIFRIRVGFSESGAGRSAAMHEYPGTSSNHACTIKAQSSMRTARCLHLLQRRYCFRMALATGALSRHVVSSGKSHRTNAGMSYTF